MTISTNGVAVGGADLTPVNYKLDMLTASVGAIPTDISASTSTILAAIAAGASVPGQIVLVSNSTGVAPTGTTKLDLEYAPEEYDMMANGTIRTSRVPHGFKIINQFSETKTIQALNANEDFICTIGSATAGARYKASNAYTKEAITFLSTGVSTGSQVVAYLDNGYFVYPNSVGASTISTLYSISPSVTSSTPKVLSTVTNWSNRYNPLMIPMANSVIVAGGATTTAPTLDSQLLDRAWEFTPSLNTMVEITSPPFKTSVLNGKNGVAYTTVGSVAYVALGARYSVGGTYYDVSPTDAIPIYRLNADRTWTYLGTALAPYWKTLGTGAVTFNSQYYLSMFVKDGYLYLVNTQGFTTGSCVMSKFDLSNNTCQLIEFSVDAIGNGGSVASSAVDSSLPVRGLVTADGKKAYVLNNITATFGMSSGVPILLSSVGTTVNKAFYVKKN